MTQEDRLVAELSRELVPAVSRLESIRGFLDGSPSESVEPLVANGFESSEDSARRGGSIPRVSS